VPPGTRVDELESAVRTVCEPIFNKPLKEISFAQVLLRLFETARRFDMRIQPQLILLQKTLLNIEGLGRELYPELDLWKTAQPILRSWMRDRMSPKAILRRIRQQLPDTVEAVKQLPQLFQTATREATEGRFRLRTADEGLERLRAEVRNAQRRRDAALGAAVLWLSGVLWLSQGTPHPGFAWILLAGALAMLVRYRTLRFPG
jgi:ubiquinone biosynthesis protein